MRWVFLAAAIALLPCATAHGGTRSATTKKLRWDSFRPKGLGINVAKPASLKLKRLPSKLGYLSFAGQDTVTGARFALFVFKGARTAAQMRADLHSLVGIAATRMTPVMSMGAVRGFKWQRSLIHTSTSGQATGVLTARHGKRAFSYVLVVRMSLAMAHKYVADLKKAYFGLKAIP